MATQKPRLTDDSAIPVIEKSIQLHKASAGIATPLTLALRAMEVGDSFLWPVRIQAKRIGGDTKFSCRAVEGGFRIWRVA